MAPTEKEIQEELKIAMEEVGKIVPWYDEEVDAWVFENEAYPVRYAGETKKEVINNYPLYLREFIFHRLQNQVDTLVEKKTIGRGGLRAGAGRPKGTTKEPTKRISVPLDIAEYLKDPRMISVIREMKLKDFRL